MRCFILLTYVSHYHVSQHYWHDGSMFKSSAEFKVLDKPSILQPVGLLTGPQFLHWGSNTEGTRQFH